MRNQHWSPSSVLVECPYSHSCLMRLSIPCTAGTPRDQGVHLPGHLLGALNSALHAWQVPHTSGHSLALSLGPVTWSSSSGEPSSSYRLMTSRKAGQGGEECGLPVVSWGPPRLTVVPTPPGACGTFL